MTLRPRATIHLSNIADNWRGFRAMVPGETGAVVKSNAYGHGASAVAARLARIGCRHFFVAYAFEGAGIRAAVGDGPRIYVFQPSLPADLPLCRANDLVPVLNDIDSIAIWTALEAQIEAILHVDTGMNRLGVAMSELGDVRDMTKGRAFLRIMSHLACADTPTHRLNRAQIEAFSTACNMFPDIETSLANTAGHWLDPEFRQGLTRPGIGLYGGGTSPQRGAFLKPGLTLEAPILKVWRPVPGETIGYGATAQTRTGQVLATVALGYADGFPRSASNNGFAMYRGVQCPIIGRVSMDLLTVDLTAVEGVAKPGELMEFIGEEADLEAQAAAAGTLGYELTTGIGSRVERHYAA